jgi:hypothetical protein
MALGATSPTLPLSQNVQEFLRLLLHLQHFIKAAQVMNSTISMPASSASLLATTSAFSDLNITTAPTPTLGGLPLELHCHIATFLSPISKALFALTCRRLYYGLDREYVKYLRDRSNSQHRRDFLEILEEDLPDYISCCRCLKLHHLRPSDGPQCAGYHGRCPLPKKGRHHRCNSFDRELQEAGYVHSNFSHVDFQKVMKLHCRGRDTTELLEILSLQPSTQLRDGYVNQTSAVARILCHQERTSLVVRQQSIWLRCASHSTPTPNWQMFQTICPHYYIDSIKPKKICLKSTNRDRRFIKSGYFQQCERCPTEFRIDEKDYYGGQSTLCITQWNNYGQGPAVGDRSWACRAPPAPNDWADDLDFSDRQILSLPFENNGGWHSVIDSLLTLTSEDEAALFDKTLKKI